VHRAHRRIGHPAVIGHLLAEAADQEQAVVRPRAEQDDDHHHVGVDGDGQEAGPHPADNAAADQVGDGHGQQRQQRADRRAVDQQQEQHHQDNRHAQRAIHAFQRAVGIFGENRRVAGQVDVKAGRLQRRHLSADLVQQGCGLLGQDIRLEVGHDDRQAIVRRDQAVRQQRDILRRGGHVGDAEWLALRDQPVGQGDDVVPRGALADAAIRRFHHDDRAAGHRLIREVFRQQAVGAAERRVRWQEVHGIAAGDLLQRRGEQRDERGQRDPAGDDRPAVTGSKTTDRLKHTWASPGKTMR